MADSEPNKLQNHSPEKDKLALFFANPYVQGVGAIIALAVGLSGKTGVDGTIICIVVAGIIGSIGIWSHSTRKTLAIILIVFYAALLFAAAKYLTAKSKEVGTVPSPPEPTAIKLKQQPEQAKPQSFLSQPAPQSNPAPLQVAPPKPHHPSEASLEFTHTAAMRYAPDNTVFLADHPIEVQVVYANTKGGIARQVFTNCSIFIFSGSILQSGIPGLQAEETEKWNLFRNTWLSNIATGLTLENDIAGLDKAHACVANTHRALKEDEARRLRDQIDVMYVLAAVKWRDGTGQYESDICSFFLPQERTFDPKAPAHWRDCITGHNATRKPFKLPD
jgi:hypothetical protein